MNLHHRGLTLALVVILVLTSAAAVSAQGGELTGTVNNFLRVYVVPDWEATDYGRLDEGTTVSLIGRNDDGNWVQVVMPDETIGWGRSNALTVDGDVMELPETAPGANQGVVVGFANLRENPIFDSASPVQLQQGTIATVVATNGEYVYVTADAGSGWVVPRAFAFVGGSAPDVPVVDGSASGYAFLRALPERDTTDFGRYDAGTPFTVLGRSADNEWFQVQTLAGDIGWVNFRAVMYEGDVEALPVSTPGAEQGVVTNFASLFAAPEFGSEPMGVRLERGTVVDVLFANDTWLYVQAGDAVGWARANAFAFMGGAVPSEALAANATVAPEDNVATVNLRSAPSVDAPRLGWANVGDRLAVVGQNADGTWYYVVPPNRVGAWVFAELVALDSSVVLPLPVVE
ncbi:MAG: SH3 domain-containing protein [Anaerolineae bacterium]|nr:SH3 domain-containing protein [Anaerolineae bacterium]